MYRRHNKTATSYIFSRSSDFKKALEEQINTSCSVLEESIVQTYEKHSKTIQDKLQELFAVLERISMTFLLYCHDSIECQFATISQYFHCMLVRVSHLLIITVSDMRGKRLPPARRSQDHVPSPFTENKKLTKRMRKFENEIVTNMQNQLTDIVILFYEIT